MKDIFCIKCGSIGNYRIEIKSKHQVAYCNDCGAYIKHVPYAEPEFHFGKYKGTKISECSDKNYLEWMLANTRQSESYRNAITKQIGTL